MAKKRTKQQPNYKKFKNSIKHSTGLTEEELILRDERKKWQQEHKSKWR